MRALLEILIHAPLRSVQPAAAAFRLWHVTDLPPKRPNSHVDLELRNVQASPVLPEWEHVQLHEGGHEVSGLVDT